MKVKWTMFDACGIYNIDGNSYSNPNGMPARMFASVTSGYTTTTQTASARACIRYLYTIVSGYDDIYTANITTGYTSWATGSYTTNPI